MSKGESVNVQGMGVPYEPKNTSPETPSLLMCVVTHTCCTLHTAPLLYLPSLLLQAGLGSIFLSRSLLV